ncbi:GNAT family N-acetyltransferase [Alkalihalobacillus hwajinpoensis]|uniref:GNAT family N-acetyltransferase n=1 Tax=Guptibacillus hwajinpoensis TaxID=208199 RepID=UPI001883D8A5|nr:GNAT family N-acetyltransferase [Pseudalkalibacillus hwajinpoensis]MBF0706812.1 GNAT family N-acetyltransferase [Pseudalkalibacillus hwajinpoensis]
MKIMQIKKGFPYDLLLDADPSLDHIERYLKVGSCYVAVEEQEVMGVYVLVEKEEEIMEIMNIAVREDRRGKGIGKKLIHDAIQRSEALGATKIEIGTGNSSLDQLALFQKCHFRITDIIEGFFDSYPETIIENGIPCRDMIRLSYSKI